MNIIMFDDYIDRTDEMINNYSSEKGHFIEFTLHNTQESTSQVKSQNQNFKYS